MNCRQMDETKLTAFALGELEGNEAEAIRKHVDACALCRKEVEEIRAMGGRMSNVLADEPFPRLAPEQRERILAASRPAGSRHRRIVFWIAFPAAAVLLIGLFLTSTEMAMREATNDAKPLPSSGGKTVGWGTTDRSEVAKQSIPKDYPGPKIPTITEMPRRSNQPKPSAPATKPYEPASEIHGMKKEIPPDSSLERTDSRDGYLFPTESYDTIVENPFLRAGEYPFSTFSIDVDTASYANVRRMLTQGQLPPAGAVRIEEMINYFTYDYPQPEGDAPFSVNAEIAACPWSAQHRLVRIGLKGKEIANEERKPSNLVFLIDVSGSMSDENKLPLVKRSLKLLTEQLDERDSVAIVVYAGNSGCVLEPTHGDNKQRIVDALDRLGAGGSTHGSAGIQLAYQMATGRFIRGGVNRVILCTDGDFNVGVTNRSDLVGLIEEKAKSGVFLSILGFGMGNYKDATLEELTNKGNGNYAYIDTINEAKKVLVEQMSGTLITIAKDVKIQIEFNPAKVNAYRLIGYENRMLRKEDFDDDKKDAGEIGAGHTVTALYEIVPAGVAIDLPKEGEPSRYQKTNKELTPEAKGDEIMLVKLRYKQPEGDTSSLIKVPVEDRGGALKTASPDFRFAAAVAEFGLILRSSKHKDRASYEDVLSLARESRGADAHGYRAEFIELVKQAERLSPLRR